MIGKQTVFPTVGQVTSLYQLRRVHPVTGVVQRHNGIDIGAPTGTPVFSPARGVVLKSGRDSLNGNLVQVQDAGTGYVYAFAHLDQRCVRVGDMVARSQQIGTVGNTGRSTGPHLHFGVKNSAGAWIEPDPWVELDGAGATGGVFGLAAAIAAFLSLRG